MATDKTEKQQQKFNSKNQQDDINKLLDAIPSNGLYQTAAGRTFPATRKQVQLFLVAVESLRRSR